MGHDTRTSHTIRLAVALVVTATALSAQGFSLDPRSSAKIHPPSEGFVERALELGIAHTAVSGIDRINGSPMHSFSGSGVALGDLDGDGDLDLVAAGGLSRNAVFLNEGTQFVDVTAASGIETGEFDRCVALGDIDNDGDLDLFLGSLDPGFDGVPAPGRSRMYRNDGTGVFTDITSLTGTIGSGHSLHARFHDLDLDGWLDLYVAEFHATPNHYYRNNGDGTFTDLSAEVGLDVAGSTHVVALGDFNGDGLPDVVTGQDWLATNATGMANNSLDNFLAGQPDGTWIDTAPDSGANTQAGIMGIAIADVDYDGDFDIYKTDVHANHLLINHEWETTGTPWERADDEYNVSAAVVPDYLNFGLTDGAVGWGTSFFNADMDPWVDLLVVNGHVTGGGAQTQWPLKQRDFLFRGLGPEVDFVFGDGSYRFDLTDLNDERAAAIGDMDGDGDVDVFIVETAGRLRYYENQIPRYGQGGIMVEVQAGTSAPHGIGAKIQRNGAGGLSHLRMIGAQGSTVSDNAKEELLALGYEPDADLVVTMPSGLRLRYGAVPAGSELLAVEPVLFDVPIQTVPALGSGLSGAPTTLPVTVFAHDAQGVPLDENAVVTIEMPGATATGPVAWVAGNEFTRTFDVPAVSGEYRVETSFNGFVPMIRPSVQVVGGCDGPSSHVFVRPEAIRPTSQSFSIECTPCDSRGVALGPGHDVDIAATSGAQPDSSSDLGDGRYVFTFTGPPIATTVVFNVKVDGILTGMNIRVEVGGAVDPGQTSFYAEQPNPIHQAGAHMYKAVLTPRDAAGRRLGPAANLVIDVHSDPGTPELTVRTDLMAPQDDGEFPIILEKDIAFTYGPQATGTFDVLVDGVIVHTEAYAY